MNPDDSDTAYNVWLSNRREDFSTTDLSLLVMRELRAESSPQQKQYSWPTAYLGVPSAFVGMARIALFFVLILIPA